MCKCTPEIRSPFCGKPGCEWPQHSLQRPQGRDDGKFECPTCVGEGSVYPEQLEDIERQAVNAARYLHLRNQDIENGTFPRPGIFIGRTMPNEVLTHEDADAAVDEARAPAPPSSPFEYCDDPSCTREKGHEGAHCDIPF